MLNKFRCACGFRTIDFTTIANHVALCSKSNGGIEPIPPLGGRICNSKNCFNVVVDPEMKFCPMCILKHQQEVAEKMCAPDPFDPSHNPSHYHEGRSIDPIGVMKETFTAAEYEGFLKGNALKYIMRYQSKNGIQDLRKCIDYIERIIDFYEK